MHLELPVSNHRVTITLCIFASSSGFSKKQELRFQLFISFRKV